MANITEEQIVRSALWAAYGDAVGFPTELVSEIDFLKRNQLRTISGPIDWNRRVGGLFGPHVPFPVGTYSDDTQLRLSTSRAIRGDGYFDVESFAKIELPVWLNYALGAGRGSKAAAANLSLRESTWSQNFYQSGNNSYWNGGGNGAAMRIQPHVWQGHRMGPQSFIHDVVRNSVCTHGHPRAIIGAAIHAHFLFYALNTQKAIPPSDWAAIGEAAAIQAYESLVEDVELSLVWIPNWENLSKKSISAEWANTVLEWQSSVETVQELCSAAGDPTQVYLNVLSQLGGFKPEERGSGLKTPLFAVVLAWLFRNASPKTGILVAANAFKSDTDTIGTMAGALIGAVAESYPQCEIQDSEYICREARRLFRIGACRQPSFGYPDLLTWTPPKNQSDAWIVNKGTPSLAGLGELFLLGAPFSSVKGNELLWQWCTLPFGQTVLAKRRASASHQYRQKDEFSKATILPALRVIQESLPTEKILRTELPIFAPKNIDEHTKLCINSGFDAKTLGESLLALSEGDTGIERAISFAAIIAKARIARKGK